MVDDNGSGLGLVYEGGVKGVNFLILMPVAVSLLPANLYAPPLSSHLGIYYTCYNVSLFPIPYSLSL